MPPRSYVVTAVVLAALVAVSLPVTMGFSIILWFWSFAAAACLLGVMGALRVVHGLHAPPWTAVVLALPGAVWTAAKLYDLYHTSPHLNLYYTFTFAGYAAFLAAAFGALRLMETVSTPHAAFRIGYGILAAHGVVLGLGSLSFATGWTFTGNPLYETPARAVGFAAMLVEYGAFIAATVLITARRSIEHWTAAAIILILLYKAAGQFFMINLATQADELAFWFEPVVMFVGGAAVWRMGSVLRSQTLPRAAVQT